MAIDSIDPNEIAREAAIAMDPEFVQRPRGAFLFKVLWERATDAERQSRGTHPNELTDYIDETWDSGPVQTIVEKTEGQAANIRPEALHTFARFVFQDAEFKEWVETDRAAQRRRYYPLHTRC